MLYEVITLLRDLAAANVLLHDRARDLRRKFRIKDAFRQNQHHRAYRAGADAARLADDDLFTHADAAQFILDRVAHIRAVGGNATRAAADENLIAALRGFVQSYNFV